MSRNRQLITTHETIDPGTGELISSYENKIDIPDKFALETNFIKVCNRAIDEIDSKKLGYFVKMGDYLEYETNRFTKRHVGRVPMPMKQKDFEEVLGVSMRTIGTIFRQLSNKLAIFYFDGFYFCNPTFVTRSQKIYTDILTKMIECDPSIRKSISKKDIRLLNISIL